MSECAIAGRVGGFYPLPRGLWWPVAPLAERVEAAVGRGVPRSTRALAAHLGASEAAVAVVLLEGVG